MIMHKDTLLESLKHNLVKLFLFSAVDIRTVFILNMSPISQLSPGSHISECSDTVTNAITLGPTNILISSKHNNMISSILCRPITQLHMI